jgi:CheY-like chemotaxis protein
MSHEMRTPLNAILGFSELLANPDLTQKQREEYQSIVKRTGATLTAIINDILDIAKIEAQQIQVTQSQFQLLQLISDVKSLLAVRCFEKGIQLYVIRKGEIADVIKSDPSRLRQILINLIGNAIKFTNEGSVTVTYEVVGDQLVFTVKDTGAGIPEEHRIRLFKPFSQGDDSVRKKYGGTGLGLMISQRMANLLGGDVFLSESMVNKGSTFVAKIAYQPVTDRAQVDPYEPLSEGQLPLEKFRGKRILVVEDTIDNQTLVRLFLAKTEAIVDFVGNGKDGVTHALKNAYDVILMDMQMPVMDGYSATEELRRSGSKTPIIAMTGYAMKKDKEKCFQAGCTDYIAKPFDRQTLLFCIAKYL